MHCTEIVDRESIFSAMSAVPGRNFQGSYALFLHLPHLGTQAIDVTILLAGLSFQWIVFK